MKDDGEWEDVAVLPANTTSTTVTGLTAGEARLRVLAEVPPVVSAPSREVSINLSAATSNGAPSVDAGFDQQVAGTATAVFLNGSAKDDGLPVSSGSLTTTWAKLSGPGTVSFGNASSVQSSVSVSTPGVYELQLTTDDGSLSSTDTMILTVTGGPADNSAPVVDAGTNQSLVLSENAILAASVTDDGLPSPPAKVIVKWHQVSGPGTASFLDDGDPQTTVNFSTPGTYVLELAANDGALSTSDTVTLTVDPDSGLPNLLLYALDADPGAGSIGGPLGLRIVEGLLIVEFESLVVSGDIEVELLVSDDLVEWHAVDSASLASENRGDTALHRLTLDMGTSSAPSFYRIRATLR